jgi:hypothetical protein
MKKLKMVGQVLTKAEQKSILGGAAMGEIYYGACNGHPGCWYYVVGVDFNTCNGDVLEYCHGNGGICSSFQLAC